MPTTYTIETVSDNGLDILIKKNFEKEVFFTLREVIAHMEKLTTEKKEVVAKMGIENAIITNVSTHNPDVAALSDEKLHAAYLIGKSKEFIKEATEHVTQIDEALDRYQKEKEEIITSLNITL